MAAQFAASLPMLLYEIIDGEGRPERDRAPAR
jgi:hypothetical protein